jgi:hypothetical protein
MTGVSSGKAEQGQRVADDVTAHRQVVGDGARNGTVGPAFPTAALAKAQVENRQRRRSDGDRFADLDRDELGAVDVSTSWVGAGDLRLGRDCRRVWTANHRGNNHDDRLVAGKRGASSNDDGGSGGESSGPRGWAARVGSYGFVDITITGATLGQIEPNTFLRDEQAVSETNHVFLTMEVANVSEKGDAANWPPTPYGLRVAGESAGPPKCWRDGPTSVFPRSPQLT